ncbi:MAG: hypothetical protein ABSC05_12760 [Candidatus Solibacter sp.]|jgi:hypothetical protein
MASRMAAAALWLGNFLLVASCSQETRAQHGKGGAMVAAVNPWIKGEWTKRERKTDEELSTEAKELAARCYVAVCPPLVLRWSSAAPPDA